MNFPTALKRSILPMLGGLLLGGYLASLLYASWMMLDDHGPVADWVGLPKIALGLSVFALLLMAPVAILIWLPLYALLLTRSRATYLTSISIPLTIALFGLLPGGSGLSALIATYGACFAVVAHALQTWHGYPMKPTPPGSASSRRR